MAMSWTRNDVIRHCAVCAATGNRIDLSGRDLTGVNLTGLDLRLADLREADLREANLREADLTGAIGIVCLHVDDPRGYRPIAVDHGTHWMIASGCRWLTVAAALAHWGAADYHTPELGQAYCRAIKELPQK